MFCSWLLAPQNDPDISGKVVQRLVDLRSLEHLLHDLCAVAQCRPAIPLQRRGSGVPTLTLCVAPLVCLFGLLLHSTH